MPNGDSKGGEGEWPIVCEKLDFLRLFGPRPTRSLAHRQIHDPPGFSEKDVRLGSTRSPDPKKNGVCCCGSTAKGKCDKQTTPSELIFYALFSVQEAVFSGPTRAKSP